LELPPIYGALILDSVYRAVGYTKPVLYATAIAALLNALLDPLLIYGTWILPRLGVSGAGYASALASSAYLAILAYTQRSFELRVYPKLPSRKVLKSIKIGLPYLGEELALVGGQLGYIGSVARCGTKALAAHTVGVRIESLAFLPMESFATAGGSLVGQEVGKEEFGEAKRVGWEASKINLMLGIAVGSFLALFGKYLSRPFTDDPQVLWLASIYLLIAGLTEPPLALAMGLAQAIRNAGNTVLPTIVNISSLVLLRVLPAYLLPQLFPRSLCVLGAWLAMALDVGGRGMIFGLLYRKFFHKVARKVI